MNVCNRKGFDELFYSVFSQYYCIEESHNIKGCSAENIDYIFIVHLCEQDKFEMRRLKIKSVSSIL
jgi:hypothetical protein